MNSDPNANPEFEHWLNEAGDEQTDPLTGDTGIDDLIDLFDDSEPTEIEVTAPQKDFKPTRMTLDFDSPEAELEALFTGETDPNEGQLSPVETSSWLAMDDEEQPEQPEQPPNSPLEPSELMGLRELLGVESDPSPSVEFSPPQDELTISSYPTLGDLDTWLDQDQQTIEPALIVSELEALIEAPPPPPVSIERESLSHSDEVEANDAEPEDEFKDLEILIEQAERSLGSVSGSSARRRIPTGNRVTRSKTFEQTMRVPIKQLDNLSNLIGELVVKRNRLEEDQERLRQFLDNLLNQAQGPQ